MYIRLASITAENLHCKKTSNMNVSSLLADLQALDLTIVKDERLAVGFFQRAGVMMQINR